MTFGYARAHYQNLTFAEVLERSVTYLTNARDLLQSQADEYVANYYDVHNYVKDRYNSSASGPEATASYHNWESQMEGLLNVKGMEKISHKLYTRLKNYDEKIRSEWGIGAYSILEPYCYDVKILSRESMEKFAKLAKLVDITKGRALLLQNMLLPEAKLGLGVIKKALESAEADLGSKSPLPDTSIKEPEGAQTDTPNSELSIEVGRGFRNEPIISDDSFDPDGADTLLRVYEESSEPGPQNAPSPSAGRAPTPELPTLITSPSMSDPYKFVENLCMSGESIEPDIRSPSTSLALIPQSFNHHSGVNPFGNMPAR
jgi:hypothetical protein